MKLPSAIVVVVPAAVNGVVAASVALTRSDPGDPVPALAALGAVGATVAVDVAVLVKRWWWPRAPAVRPTPLPANVHQLEPNVAPPVDHYVDTLLADLAV